MPLYSFAATDGSRTDIFYRMADAPSIGTEVLVDGKPFKRVFCGLIGDGTMAQHALYPYVSNSLSPNIRGAKKVREKLKGNKGWTREKPLIRSRKHEREVQAMNDLDRH